MEGKPPPGGLFWAYAEDTMKRLEAENKLVYSSTGYPQVKYYLDEMPGQRFRTFGLTFSQSTTELPKGWATRRKSRSH